MKSLITLPALALIALTAPAFASGSGGTPGAHFIENFDEDGDGIVTLEEVRTKRGDILYMFDANDDGILTSEEYDMFDETRAADHENEEGGQGKGGQGKGDKGEGMTREVTDLNGDGQVTLEEFQAATDAWFAGKDRNGDGIITTADFGPRGN